jgi:hypothetical protein
VGICMLVIENDKLNVGDDVATSSEVAKGRTHMGRLGEVTWMDLVTEWNAWGTSP